MPGNDGNAIHTSPAWLEGISFGTSLFGWSHGFTKQFTGAGQ